MLVQAGQDFHFIGRNDGGPGPNGPGPRSSAAGGGSRRGWTAPPPQPQAHRRPVARSRAGTCRRSRAPHRVPCRTSSTTTRRGPSPVRTTAMSRACRTLPKCLSCSATTPLRSGIWTAWRIRLTPRNFQAAKGASSCCPRSAASRGFEEYQAAFGPGGTLAARLSVSRRSSRCSPRFRAPDSRSEARAASRWEPAAVHRHVLFRVAGVAGAKGPKQLGLEMEALKGNGVTAGGGPIFVRHPQNRLTAGFSRVDQRRQAGDLLPLRLLFPPDDSVTAPDSIRPRPRDTRRNSACVCAARLRRGSPMA